MKAECIVSNSSIDRAANTLLSQQSGEDERRRAQELVNEWRASFDYPLAAVLKQLEDATHNVKVRVICSSRLKRMESILGKLRRPETRHMKLSRMQDIGGCRAIFPDLQSLDSFWKLEEQKIKKSASYVDSLDYIKSPKPDGYRGIHVIVRPEFSDPKYSGRNSHRIEIQLRTSLQHAWATTVESVDMFHSQSIKTGGGDLKWRRFFALCSTVIAIGERSMIIPGTFMPLCELVL